MEIEQITKLQVNIKNQINAIMGNLPNIALNDVPIGKDEKNNKEIKIIPIRR